MDIVVKRSKRTMSGVLKEQLDQDGRWYAQGAKSSFTSVPDACRFLEGVKDKDGNIWIEKTEESGGETVRIEYS